MDQESQDLLKSAHRSTQYQLLSKLAKNVETFISQNGIIGETSVTCPDFQQLVQYLGDDSPTISWHVSKLLYGLVETKAVLTDSLISICITQSALGLPLRGIVFLVVRLLHLNQDKYEKIPVAEHPLARILTNQGQSSNCIFSMICQFLVLAAEKDTVEGSESLLVALNLLKPFFSFALMDDSHSLDFVSAVLDVSSVLLLNSPCNVIELIQMIVSTISNPLTISKNGIQLLPIVLRVGVWFLDHAKFFQESALKWNIISLLITVSWNAVNKQNNDKIMCALHLLKKLIPVNTSPGRTGEVGECKDELIFVCAMMLMKVDESISLQCLHILMMVLPSHVESQSLNRLQPLLSILVLPTIQLLYENKPRYKSQLVNMGENLLRNIESFLSINEEKVEDDAAIPYVNKRVNAYSEIMNVAQSSLNKLFELFKTKEVALAWCKDICTTHQIKKSFMARDNIVLQLSAMLIFNTDEDIFKEGLNAMTMMCTRHSHMVSVFLPLLLYLLKNNKHAPLKIAILYCFPKIATGKTVISSILKVILSLSESPQLLPVCIMLMTTLWLEQPRIYPYLLQLLSVERRRDSNISELWFEHTLARVTGILQVCKTMPTRHGNDMVVLISNIMEDVIAESHTSSITSEKYASCLALLIEGLKSLCANQVIDIRSIWKAVVVKVKVKNDRTVLESLCSLLSCFPSLVGEGAYSFLEEVVAYLWSLVVNQDPCVVGAAYKALSVFPVEMMKIKLLPAKYSDEISQQLCTLKEHKEDEEYNPMEEVCPGFGFMLLLQQTPARSLEGFREFLNAALQHEVTTLPRGIGLRSFAKPLPALYNQIPNVLQSQYEASNRPAVLPGIAAGILCCYEPSIKISGFDDGNPSNHHLKLIMGRNKMMLDNLLQEFTIRQNDWHQAILAPRSWSHYMKKVYDVFMKGRIAELIIKEEKGEIDDDESHKEEIDSVKFWARDEITNQLRKASKGTPKLQGNSMFALAGLLNAVLSYEEEGEGGKTEAPDQYIATRTWMLKVTDTIMTVFDGNFKAKGKPFQWCQQVSSERSTASSNLSRCCAAVALSELVQPLLSIDTGRLLQMIHILKKASLGSANSGSITQFHFYCFIGWGLLLSRLSQEQFTELCGTDGRSAMLTSLTTLESVVFNEETNEHAGPVIGYGLAISSSLTHSTQKDAKVHALLSYEKLLSKVTVFTKEDTGMLNNQAFCYALACTTVNAYMGGSISSADVLTCTELIYEKLKKDLNSSDLHITLGVLCHALLISTAKNVSTFIGGLFEKWIELLTSDESPLLAKLGCIKGITAACGVNLLVFKFRDPDKYVEIPQMRDAVKLLQRLTVNCKDSSISYLAAQSSGQIYLINQVRNLGENSAIPQNYNYLKEKSLLRTVFNALLSAVSLGPHSHWSNDIIDSLMSSLHNLHDARLPPVNWTAVLNPVLRIGYNKHVKITCVKFAIKFIHQSSSLTRSITSWLQPSAFVQMEDEIQKEFFTSASSYLSALSNSEQKSLLDTLPLTYLSYKQQEGKLDMDSIKCVLQLWNSILQMQCSVQSSLAYILSGMEKLVGLICFSIPPAIIISGCLEEFACCLFSMLKEEWINAYSKLKCHPTLWCRLQIQMLKYADGTQVETVVTTALLALQVEDVGIQSCLLRTFLELNRGRYDENVIRKVVLSLVSHEEVSKGYVDATTDAVLLLLMLSSPLDWEVLPYVSVSLKSCFASVFGTLKGLLPFSVHQRLTPKLVEKMRALRILE